MPKPIRVFEHEYLDIGTKGFEKHHWKALAYYNLKNGNKYFTLLPEGIKFNQYVGVIQAGNLTIEILPKADRKGFDEQNKNRWHHALIEMLRDCQYIKIDYPEQASLTLHKNSILDTYLNLFLDALQQLMHEGLIKKYRKQEGNQTALKGQFLFSKQISNNLVHKERFYVRHTIYDKDHLIHQVLFQALKLVQRITTNPIIKGKSEQVRLNFPEVKEIKVTEETFQRIIYDRKTWRYKDVLLIGKMILLNYRPGISGGTDHVLAILFDMNKLWEEYVYRQLIKLNPAWRIDRQYAVNFWKPEQQMAKTLRPDLVIRNHETGCVVIDTKWKWIEDDYPADTDIQQMFAYAHYVKSKHVILLYPSDTSKKTKGQYIKKHLIGDGPNAAESIIKCALLKVGLKWQEDRFCGLDISINDFQVLFDQRTLY